MTKPTETVPQAPVETVGTRSSPRRQLTVAIPATPADVSIVGDTLRAFRAAPSGEPVSDNIDLGVIEALNNIVEHAYEERAEGFIEIVYKEYVNCLMVEIIDRGRPIPSQLMEKSVAESVEFGVTDIQDLDEGGRGLLLIKALFDGIEYTRACGQNRLRLTKTITAPRSASRKL